MSITTVGREPSKLVPVLRGAVEEVIAFANGKGIGSRLPVRTYTVRWLEATGTTTYSGHQEDRTEPDLMGFWNKYRDELEALPAFRLLQAAAAQFVLSEGKAVTFTSLLEGRQGEKLVCAYLDRVGAFAIDESALESICGEFESHIRSDSYVAKAVFNIEGFKAPAAFFLQDVKVRPISEKDFDTYGLATAFRFGLSERPLDDQLRTDSWICEVERRIAKDDMDTFNRLEFDVIDAVLPALALTMGGKATVFFLMKCITSPFLSAFVPGVGKQRPVTTSRTGEPLALDASDVARLQNASRRIARIQSDDRLAHLRLPLRRLQLAAARTHDEDHLVDCMIALENLLASDSDKLETTFRFRLRGAAVLPPEFGSEAQRLKLMGGLYGLRSEVVHAAKQAHGSGKKAAAIREKVRVGTVDAERVLRAILGWFVERSDNPANLMDVPTELDIAMVKGGRQWASE